MCNANNSPNNLLFEYSFYFLIDGVRLSTSKWTSIECPNSFLKRYYSGMPLLNSLKSINQKQIRLTDQNRVKHITFKKKPTQQRKRWTYNKTTRTNIHRNHKSMVQYFILSNLGRGLVELLANSIQMRFDNHLETTKLLLVIEENEIQI